MRFLVVTRLDQQREQRLVELARETCGHDRETETLTNCCVSVLPPCTSDGNGEQDSAIAARTIDVMVDAVMMLEVAIFDRLRSCSRPAAQHCRVSRRAALPARRRTAWRCGGSSRASSTATPRSTSVTDVTMPFASTTPKRRAGSRPSTSTNERRAITNRSPFDAEVPGNFASPARTYRAASSSMLNARCSSAPGAQLQRPGIHAAGRRSHDRSSKRERTWLSR